MNTEETSENIFTSYIKRHYGEAILAKIRKLEKTMIKYSSNTNHLQVLFVAIQKNMGPFYGWGSTGLRLEPLRGGSLLFTTKFPGIPGTHFIDLRGMKG